MRAKFVNEYVVLPPKSKEDIIRDLKTLSRDELNKQLLKACEQGLTNIAQWIIDAGANVNTKSMSGWTPLMIAAMNGHKDIVKLFLDNDADINIKDYEQCTALRYALRYGHKDIVKLLKKYGAKDESQVCK